MKGWQQIKRIEQIFKAFACEKRMRILMLLYEKERCECEITAGLAISQPLAAQHIRKLLTAGLIEYRSEGKWRIFRIVENEFMRNLMKTMYRKLRDNKIIKNDKTRGDSVSCEV